MPRSPARDYADRCTTIELAQQGLSRREIAQRLQRPARWVRRTLARFEPAVGLASLRDHSSRPQRSPSQTPADLEQAICDLKQTHPVWGRRQITRQLRWRWRADPVRSGWLTESRVRCVLARHPELPTPAPARVRRAPRQINYLTCNLIWAVDIQDTRLADGSRWQTLHWIDLHSRYVLGQLTVPRLTEALVVASFLDVARQYGLPRIIKADHDKLWFDAISGLPSLLTRVLTALGIYHLLVGPKQPWWNGVVERYVRTCRAETALPEDGADLPQVMANGRDFYNQERCHSRCQDQPPVTVYQPSPQRLPADFDLAQVPLTLAPTIVTRQVQADGRISLAGRTFHFQRRYAGQTIAVTVTGWAALAQAKEGWHREYDLRPAAPQPPAPPAPAMPPPPLTRIVNRRGNIALNSYLYYVGIAWIGQKLQIERVGACWQVSLPDGATKALPCKHLFPQVARTAQPTQLPPPQPRPFTPFQTRRVTQLGQIAFHKRFYYVGRAHKGEIVGVAATPEGLAIYTTDAAWIRTCPWKQAPPPVEPLCPT